MKVTTRGDHEYEEQRQNLIWNRRTPPRFPAEIVISETAADVVDTVKRVCKSGLRVTARGGGHQWWGAALPDGGVVLDMSRLRQVSIDADAGTADLQPGVLVSELARMLYDRALAFPVGHCPSVAMSGYLLGGGIGWNWGAWGPACLSVTAAEVVTDGGELIRADESTNAELLWAVRGAGPMFPGVVTRYTVKLQPQPDSIRTSLYTYPISAVGEVASWLAEARPRLPLSVETSLILRAARTEHATGTVTLRATAFVSSDDEAEHALSALDTTRPPGMLSDDLRAQSPIPLLLARAAETYPDASRYAVDNLWATASASELLSVAADLLAAAPQPGSHIVWAVPPMSVVADVADANAAFSLPRGPKLGWLGWTGVWDSARDDDENLRWFERTSDELKPFARGRYIGETNLFASPDRAEECFSHDNWTRLQELREAWDPAGVFDPPFLSR